MNTYLVPVAFDYSKPARKLQRWETVGWWWQLDRPESNVPPGNRPPCTSSKCTSQYLHARPPMIIVMVNSKKKVTYHSLGCFSRFFFSIPLICSFNFFSSNSDQSRLSKRIRILGPRTITRWPYKLYTMSPNSY